MPQYNTKKHRLPAEHYCGPKRVSITACIQKRQRPFSDPWIVDTFKNALVKWTLEKACVASIYCFVPDHLHVILVGTHEGSRPKEAMDEFKETTGTWFAQNRPEFKWQKNYHDHIIRASDDWRNHVRYILRNPVRAGLVENPLDYPYMGSIGPDLQEVLWEL